MDKGQTGGRFIANGEAFNSSTVLLHKRTNKAILEFKYVNSSCKGEKKHLYYSFV